MYSIDYIAISDLKENDHLKKSLQNIGPAIIEVMVDPEQTYFPKITSFVDTSGNMQSQPLHRMTPELPSDVYKKLTLGLLD
jgi:acetolactate synthase-1/2/3 large subunit